MNQLLFLHRRAAISGLRDLLRQPIGNLLALILMGIAVALPLCLHLVVQAAQEWSRYMTIHPEITVFMELSASRTDVAVVDEALQQLTTLEDYRFLGREEALKTLLERQKLQDIAPALGENPLPDAFILTPKPMPPEQMEALAETLSQLPKVDSAQFDSGWARKVNHAIHLLQRFTGLMGMAFAAGLVLMTHNIIRMQILSKKAEIEVSRLIGAPNAFIRRPFLYLAAWQGFVSALIGLLLSSAFAASINPLLTDFAALYQEDISILPLSFSESLSLIFSLIGLAILAAHLASTQILNALDKSL